MKDILQEHNATIAIILAIIITAILSFTDLISDEEVVSYLICAVAGLATNIFFSSLKNGQKVQEIERSLVEIKEKFDNVIELADSKATSRKVTRKEHYKMLNAAAINAESHIWLMTIDLALNRKVVNTIPERETYYATIENIAKTRREVSIRRIYGLPIDDSARADKIEWIRSDIERIKECPNYHVRIFDWRKFNSIPSPLSLQIIDDVFVGLVNLQQASTGVEGGGEDLCIEDHNVVQHLRFYYEAVWEKCDELKSGECIMLENLC